VPEKDPRLINEEQSQALLTSLDAAVKTFELNVQAHQSTTIVVQRIELDLKNVRKQLESLQEQLRQISRIVIGDDGGQGIRAELGKVQSQVGSIEQDLRAVKDAQSKLKIALENEAKKEIEAQSQRFKTIADWAWKIGVFVIGFILGIPALIKTLRELFSK
jgi:chromosome segregation ATPase